MGPPSNATANTTQANANFIPNTTVVQMQETSVRETAFTSVGS